MFPASVAPTGSPEAASLLRTLFPLSEGEFSNRAFRTGGDGEDILHRYLIAWKRQLAKLLTYVAAFQGMNMLPVNWASAQHRIKKRS